MMTVRHKKLLSWVAGAGAALILAGGIAYHLLMPRMLFLGVPPQQLFLLADAADETGIRFWFWMRERMDDPELETADFSRYDVIFISSRRMEPLTRAVQDGIGAAAARGAGVFFLPADRNARLGGFAADPAHAEQLSTYWEHSGPRNIANLFRFAASHYLGSAASYEDPQPTPDDGYYHPEAPDLMLSTSEYVQWTRESGRYREGAPHILLDFADGWRLGMTTGTGALLEAFESRGVNVAAIFGNQKMPQFVREFQPDLVISRRHGRWFQGPRGVELLESEFDFPVMRGTSLMFTGETFEEYRQTKNGLRGVGLAMGAIVPEIDGAIEPTLIEGMRAEWSGRRFEAVERERIDRLADRALRWVQLRVKPNAEKKVAIIYVSGIGKGKITAASLNVPRSLIRFLKGMRDAGYRVEGIPADADALLADMLRKGRNISESQQGELADLASLEGVTLIDEGDYLRRFSSLPDALQEEVVATFGPPPGGFMTVERDGRRKLVLPKLDFGDVILMPQPARGANMDARLQHNDRVPPNHQYLAAYWWLQDDFQADAIVNYGTHGTHEFLPGRPLGQLADDWSDITLGRMPNVYVYIMDNVGEALIAKRRGSAVTVDHQVPPIGAASLSEADPETGELYRATEQFVGLEEGSLKERLREQIARLGNSRGFDEDLGLDWSDDPPSDEQVAELKLHIHLINEDRIPLGLHVHSRSTPAREAAPLVTSMVGNDYVRRVAFRELGLSEEGGTRWEAARQRAVRNVEAALEGRGVAPSLRPDEGLVNGISAALRLTSREIPRTLHALEGGYIPPGPGGDPVRNPGALPTARNLYGINPQEVPTKAAWEVGVSLADALLDAERERLGRYPRKVGFTLWNTELIRHYGTDLAQILHLIGVRPVWDHNGIVADLDLVPVEELGRPRVDVVIQAASLFRDTFPDRMEFLDKAVRLAAGAIDGNNFIAEHVDQSQIELKRAGMSAEDARLFAGARVFSNNVGGYGTGVIDNTIRSGEFEDTSKLTEEYLAKVGAVYTEGADWGAKIDGLYRQALAGTEAVSLSRSTNVISPLTLDHYFEYLGGMTMAVRDTSGTSPETYVSDVRDAERGRLETVRETLTRDLRGKYWNPRWIREQQDEGFSGAVEMAQTATNLFGWQVTKPEAIDDYVWDEVQRVYVEDSLGLGLPDWFDQENPYAIQNVTAVLIEAARKGYWEADPETLIRVANRYARSVADHGPAGDARTVDNVQFHNFLGQALTAPGNLEGTAIEVAYTNAVDRSAGLAGSDLVQGRRLVRSSREAAEPASEPTGPAGWQFLAIAALGAALVFGLRRRKRT
ncbi:MAG: cobaltochelatase subunit CobN [Bryobacterales bacterium]|nr:cobaltochelatase subunit CobN [Bryobacterales bacterium]